MDYRPSGTTQASNKRGLGQSPCGNYSLLTTHYALLTLSSHCPTRAPIPTSHMRHDVPLLRHPCQIRPQNSLGTPPANLFTRNSATQGAERK